MACHCHLLLLHLMLLHHNLLLLLLLGLPMIVHLSVKWCLGHPWARSVAAPVTHESLRGCRLLITNWLRVLVHESPVLGLGYLLHRRIATIRGRVLVVQLGRLFLF